MIKKKKPIRKIGKIGQRNIEANKFLKEIYIDKEITTCELGFTGCTHNNFLSFAHRHKREWYRKYPELLYYFNETILACVKCHDIIEVSKGLTEKVFNHLRQKNNERN